MKDTDENETKFQNVVRMKYTADKGQCPTCLVDINIGYDHFLLLFCKIISSVLIITIFRDDQPGSNRVYKQCFGGFLCHHNQGLNHLLCFQSP